MRIATLEWINCYFLENRMVRERWELSELLVALGLVCVCVCMCVCSVVSNSLWPHGVCSLPDSSVHVILQARILEWVATSFSRGSSQPRDGTHIYCISCIGRWVLYHQRHLGSSYSRLFVIVCATEFHILCYIIKLLEDRNSPRRLNVYPVKVPDKENLSGKSLSIIICSVPILQMNKLNILKEGNVSYSELATKPGLKKKKKKRHSFIGDKL